MKCDLRGSGGVRHVCGGAGLVVVDVQVMVLGRGVTVVLVVASMIGVDIVMWGRAGRLRIG